jgi:hypothetical protein
MSDIQQENLMNIDIKITRINEHIEELNIQRKKLKNEKFQMIKLLEADWFLEHRFLQKIHLSFNSYVEIIGFGRRHIYIDDGEIEIDLDDDNGRWDDVVFYCSNKIYKSGTHPLSKIDFCSYQDFYQGSMEFSPISEKEYPIINNIDVNDWRKNNKHLFYQL